MAKTITTRKPTEIAQAALNRVTVKATGEVFYTVRSDSDAATWYELHFERDAWQCSCPSTKPCKHQRALNELLRAKQALKREQAGPTCEKLDPMDAEVAVTGVALLAHYAEQAETRQSVTAELKKAVFAELQKQYDYRVQPKPVPVATAPAPIAQRGSLNGSRAFSLMR